MRSKFRKSYRSPVSLHAEIFPAGPWNDKDSIPGRVRNLSQDGICLQIKNHETRDENALYVQLSLPSRSQPLKLIGKVIWQKPLYQEMCLGVHVQGISCEDQIMLHDYLDRSYRSSLKSCML